MWLESTHTVSKIERLLVNKPCMYMVTLIRVMQHILKVLPFSLLNKHKKSFSIKWAARMPTISFESFDKGKGP